MIKLDYSKTGISDREISRYRHKILTIHNELHEKSNDQNEFLGWIDLPANYNKKEFEKIKKVANKIKKDTDVFIIIGIGGSYLGARAVIESLTNTFHNMLDKKKRNVPQIIYAGNNISPNYIHDIIDYIRQQRHFHKCYIKIRNNNRTCY